MSGPSTTSRTRVAGQKAQRALRGFRRRVPCADPWCWLVQRGRDRLRPQPATALCHPSSAQHPRQGARPRPAKVKADYWAIFEPARRHRRRRGGRGRGQPPGPGVRLEVAQSLAGRRRVPRNRLRAPGHVPALPGRALGPHPPLELHIGQLKAGDLLASGAVTRRRGRSKTAPACRPDYAQRRPRRRPRDVRRASARRTVTGHRRPWRDLAALLRVAAVRGVVRDGVARRHRRATPSGSASRTAGRW